MRALTLATLLAVGALSCDDHCQWAAWKAKYDKSYSTVEEDQHRFEVFRANVAEYARRNAEPDQTATYAPDRFSDMTREEFSAAYLMPGGVTALRRTPPRNAPDAPVRRTTVPASYLSPYTTTARQQGTCGSCWAFTSAAVMEGANMKATGSKEWVSPQNLLDCADYNFGNFGSNYDGCQGYRTDSMLSEIADKGANGGGVMFEKNYAYEGRMASCRHTLSSKGDVTVSNYFTERLDEADGSSLYSRLMQYGPMGVAFNCGNINGYSGGIVKHSSNCVYTQTGYNGADHAVTLVGWGVQNGVKYWVIKNSWGADWGEPKDHTAGGSGEGYFRIQRGVNACHLADDAAVGVTIVGTKSESVTPAPSSSHGPQPCTPKSKSKACGSRKCGAVDNGCGNPITCGYCSNGQACSTSGQCSNVDDTVDWVQVSPAGSSDFVMSKSGNGVTIETSTTSFEEKRAMWKTSGQWINEQWTSFSVNVKADAAGVVGIGMRMGQSNGDLNSISWKLYIPDYDGTSDYATAYLLRCFYYDTEDQCRSLAELSMAMNTFHNFTVNFALQGDTIAMRPYLNGWALMGNNYFWIERSYFPNVGSAFVVASGAGKHFQYPKLRTRTTVKVAMKSCHTTDDWASEVARILKVPRQFIVDVLGQRTAGSACGSDLFDSFNVTLLDSNATIGILAQAALPAVAGVDQVMFSNALAEQLTQTVAGGGLENMGIVGATAEVVAPALAEEAVAATIAATAAGAALSTGAIVGIAVGGSVAALAVVGAGVGVGVYAVKRRQGRAAEPKEREEYQQPKSNARGVDVMSNTQQHQSISGRAPPVNV
eukprot:m51a1_g1901 hypothetical protein (822) ;mRNA; f:775609-778258